MKFVAVTIITAAMLATVMATSMTRLGLVGQPAARKMCADLCSSGLGGFPCGEMCYEVLKFKLEKLHSNGVRTSTPVEIVGPRRSVCPTLCPYGLGYPLCECAEGQEQQLLPPVDWRLVCHDFCVLEGVQVFGCKACDVSSKPEIPASTLAKAGKKSAKLVDVSAPGVLGDVDWDEECKLMCQAGDGGSACSCDIPP